MSGQASLSLRGRNPDVLTCIANLSNDEVFTPPEFANRMLDTLAEAWAVDNNGANLWADETVRFLDPCTKSGVFLREITARLTKGLAGTGRSHPDQTDIWYRHNQAYQPYGPPECVLLQARTGGSLHCTVLYQ